MFKTIVVGDDGSEHGARAMAQARTLAADSGGRLVVVHVTELIGGKGGTYPLAIDEPEIRERLEETVAELQHSGVQATLVERTVQLGGPAHVIHDVVEAEDADLVVVGSRGQSLLSEMILGSVPLRLLHIAHVPLLIVPPPRQQKTSGDHAAR